MNAPLHQSGGEAAVNRRAGIINILFIASAVIGIGGAWQIMQGASLHKFNALHLKYNHKLDERVRTFQPDSAAEADAIANILEKIRAQPVACLDMVGIPEKIAFAIAGASRALELCREDLVLVDETIARFQAYRRGALSHTEIIETLSASVREFRSKSAEFEPLVAQTVDLVFFSMMFLIVIKSWVLAVFGARMTRQLAQSYHQLAEEKRSIKIREERFDLAINGSNDGVWDWDVPTNEVFFTDRNFEMLGVGGRNQEFFSWWEERVHPNDKQRVFDALQDHMENEAPYDVTYRIQHQDGGWRWWRSRGEAIRGPDGKAIRLVGTNSDVTEIVNAHMRLKEARDALDYEAKHDSLTGLPNRRYLNHRLAEIAQQSYTSEVRFIIAHIDLDKFKEVNDTFGHAAGDTVLRHCGRVLSSALEDGEFVTRVGGDEFILVSENAYDVNDFAARMDWVIERISDPIPYEDKSCRIGASIGISMGQGGEVDTSEVMLNADLALYRVKDAGGGGCRVFDEALGQEEQRKKTLTSEIFAALSKGEFFPVFQPQFDAHTLEIVGCEVLARWRHPEKGVLSPDAFIDHCETIGVTPEIDSQIFQAALRAIHADDTLRSRLKKLSFNVSARRLSDPGLAEAVTGLNADGLDISFELLESIFLDDISEVVSENLAALRRANINLEIDDFGTGHASIKAVMRVRPSRLKLDGSLVKPMTTDESKVRIVKSIIDIGHALNTQIVAEGVETMGHVRLLSVLGCDVVQGFALAKPMPLEALKTFVDPKATGTVLEAQVS